VAKEFKVDWCGNSGYCSPGPRTMETVKCGSCGANMDVRRNVLGATSWAEAMGHREHLHDSFICPNKKEGWHEKINDLKAEWRKTASNKIKKILEEEVIEILEANIK